MLDQIRKLLHAVPFVLVKIRTTDGREFLVPTGDHAYVAPNATGIVLGDDEGLYTILSGIHIVSVEATNLVA
jgi:hypothetical protein